MVYANVELLAGAIRQMSVALEQQTSIAPGQRSLRSCGVACLLLKVLARDTALGTDLCAACQDAGNTLERLLAVQPEDVLSCKAVRGA